MNHKDDAVSLNIVLLPSEEVLQKAIGLSATISQAFNTHFILNDTTILPHITLYQAHYPTKNLEEIEQILSSLCTTIKPITILMNNFSIVYDTFLFWNCVKTAELIQMHTTIVNTFNPLRENLILPNLASIQNMDDRGKEELQTYGSLLIGPRFTPHITITRLKSNDDANNVLKNLQKNDAKDSFETKEIVLGYLGDHGTVTGIIKKFSL